jgi:hypothetical protein
METVFSRNRLLFDDSYSAGRVELCVKDMFGTSQEILAVAYRKRNTQEISLVGTGKCETLLKFETLLIKILPLRNKGMCYSWTLLADRDLRS